MTAATHPYRQNLGISSQNHLTVRLGEESSRPAMHGHSSSFLSLSERQNGRSEPLEDVANESSPASQRQLEKPGSSTLSTTDSTSHTPNSSRSAIHDSMNPSDTPNSTANKRRSRSLDLSHLYLLNNKDTQFTATNESVADLSHQMISQCLGDTGNASLVPRLKTIEMYKQNVKKSKDPNVLFQYAQYMLQTALTIEDDDQTAVNKTASSLSVYKGDSSVSKQELKRQFLKEAQHYLKRLSVKGYADAQYLLADAYSSGAFGKVNNKDAFVLFQSAAKHGHIESAYRTAFCFEEGLGTTRDSRKAVEFLKFAASRNHSSAMFKLGIYSFYGRMGLPHDTNTKQNGIKWLSRAAAKANELTCAAPYELAKIYQHGFSDILIPDQKYAMELYIQASSLGHAPSATILGKIYESGNDVVPQDTSLSVHYYTQGALHGDPEAMLGLCAWYLVGAEPAFEKDEKEAFQWALRAAKQGLPKAQFTVGYFYEKGKGCQGSKENAQKYYELAANNNDVRAIQKLWPEGKSHKKNKSVSTMNLFSTSSINLLREPENFPETRVPNSLLADDSVGDDPANSSLDPNLQTPQTTHSRVIVDVDLDASKSPLQNRDAGTSSQTTQPILNLLPTPEEERESSPKFKNKFSLLNGRKTSKGSSIEETKSSKKKRKDCVIM